MEEISWDLRHPFIWFFRERSYIPDDLEGIIYGDLGITTA